MLFNATQPEEVRVAIVDGQKLVDLDIETSSREQKKANIYKGRITRVEPSLEAAFVDYGAERHGFLPLKEVSRNFFRTQVDGRPNIREVLEEGQEIVVQIDKEERGNKGAALTTFISLAGRYLVLMPNNPRAGGVSRRIEGDDRTEVREAMSDLNIPEGMGLIVRTAGVGKSAEELQWDLDYLLQLWTAIDTEAKISSAPLLIYRESNIIIRAIRDYFRKDISDILIDNPDVFKQAQDFMAQVMPHNLSKVKQYIDPIPLFSRYQIESQIESAFQREVSLPSGGSIVIDHTEALVSIDINSARATRGSDIEETALMTNLEASDEIARQLRLRDLGGLIVIDFIDMTPTKNQREVEIRLRDALDADRARVQIGRISRFGLLEMSRQRLRPALGEHSQITCPRCKGQGRIRAIESLSLSILRMLEEGSMKENTGRIIAKLPVDVATYLLNEKRSIIVEIERRQNVEILLVPTPAFETPVYEIERLRRADVAESEVRTPSYAMIQSAKEDHTLENMLAPEQRPANEEPAVKGVTPPKPKPESIPAPVVANKVAPVQPEPEKTGLVTRIFHSLFGGGAKTEVKIETSVPTTTRAHASTNAPASQQPAAREGSTVSPQGPRERTERTDRNRRPQRRGGRGGRGEGRSDGRGNREDATAEAGAREPRGDEPRQARSEESTHTRHEEPRREQTRQEPRPPREERGPRTDDRGERSERADRGERPEGGASAERGPRPERTDRGPRPERTDRGPRPERTDRGPRPERTDRGPRSEPGERAERTDPGQRPEQGERPDRNSGDRHPRPAHQEQAALPPVVEPVRLPPPAPRAEPAQAVEALNSPTPIAAQAQTPAPIVAVSRDNAEPPAIVMVVDSEEPDTEDGENAATTADSQPRGPGRGARTHHRGRDGFRRHRRDFRDRRGNGASNGGSEAVVAGGTESAGGEAPSGGGDSHHNEAPPAPPAPAKNE